jgi:hypothetical protein
VGDAALADESIERDEQVEIDPVEIDRLRSTRLVSIGMLWQAIDPISSCCRRRLLVRGRLAGLCS